MGLAVGRAGRLRWRELGGPCGREASPPRGEHKRDRRRAALKALVERLPEHEEVPLFIFDASYDPVQLQQGLVDNRTQILVRLRAGRCFYADPVGPPAKTGRPRPHAGRRWIPAIPIGVASALR